ncbi:hypothetical protein [Mycobacterium sp. SM1]|uniref:hypothetical protein n=1 Tax=Mycobacterium sp. SM1 TaxID=2816243 RepID=UPI001F1C2007|nr:hypothetical protein [Mycobacterium sp. SM1]
MRLFIAAGSVACAAAVALASPALAQPSGEIPGDGVFKVGTDVAPGTYHTQGPSDWSEICSWATYSTLGATEDDMVDGDVSRGPMYANVPATVAAFETNGCQPWTPVS